MKRRRFLVGVGSSLLGDAALANSPQVEVDGTVFEAWHEEGRLTSRFTAPTRGWIAVGFNNQRRLKGTRFVIGAMRDGGFYAEEHIAVVPDHPRVQDLGLQSAVERVSGAASGNQTTMQFSLPHLFADSENPTLLSGTSSYLMLAWSHETDFGHHSAWRKHFLIEL